MSCATRRSRLLSLLAACSTARSGSVACRIQQAARDTQAGLEPALDAGHLRYETPLSCQHSVEQTRHISSALPRLASRPPTRPPPRRVTSLRDGYVRHAEH
ncbi:hypothetical protein K466DRAFT_592015 [Polyporus arcularius HHB13444]|uniref:Secreted protein n=1 Tax=Polyporus arcularius HHB13444 TaxID=1314778 RepID=A0A5C3NSZ9_9APHY|nr:hypothetical protein K466DRAFT_592015 [Polyporus arcularius HHB13444]